jgi:integrase/recombinase XerD
MAAAREDYLLSCQVEGKTKRTLGLYADVTGRFACFVQGKALEDVAPHDVRSYLATLNCSTVTVNIHCRTLRAFFSFLAKNGYIKSNPMDGITTPKVPRVFPYVLSEEEVSALLKVAKPDVRDYTILLFLLDTGVRASELCGISVDDVSLAVRSTRVFGKGAKERTVYFSDVTARALARWLSVRNPSDYETALFVGRLGEALTASGVLQIVRRVGKKAGLEGKRVSPHTLRHTFATLYVKEGGDAHSLQQMLGHTTTKMAEAYVNLVGRDLADAHRKYSPVGRLKRQIGSL